MKIFFGLPIRLLLILSLTAGIASLKSRGQSAPETPFSVAGRFEPGPTPRSVRFFFSVQPAPRTTPLVKVLGETPHQDSISLTPVFDRETALYSVTFDVSGAHNEQRLQVEIPQNARQSDIHFVTVALREHATSGPMSRSSVDGNFALYTAPEGLPAEAQLLIASLERPLDPFPSNVPPADVLSVHSVAFVGAADWLPQDWKITVSVDSAITTRPALLFLASGGRDWININGLFEPEHALVMAQFNGPGTYLLLSKVPQ